MFRKILTTLVIAGILAASFFLEIKLNSYRLEKTDKDTLSSEVIIDTDSGREIDWGALQKKNEDVKGWIYLPDSAIDYPILQGEDNEYYLHRDINKNYLFDGCIYIDANCKNPFKGPNTVIFGHKMLSGAMFADLKKYSDKDYWNEHRIIYIYTPEENYKLIVTAYTRTNEYSDIYKPIDEIVNDEFSEMEGLYFTKEDFLNLVEKEAEIIERPLDREKNYATLSTCVYSDSEERQQVVCCIEETKEAETHPAETGSLPIWLNKFLVAQVVVGIIALAVILSMISPKRG